MTEDRRVVESNLQVGADTSSFQEGMKQVGASAKKASDEVSASTEKIKGLVLKNFDHKPLLKFASTQFEAVKGMSAYARAVQQAAAAHQGGHYEMAAQMLRMVNDGYSKLSSSIKVNSNELNNNLKASATVNKKLRDNLQALLDEEEQLRRNAAAQKAYQDARKAADPEGLSQRLNQIGQLADKYDRVGASLKRLNQDQADLAAAFRAGLVSAERFKTAIAEIDGQRKAIGGSGPDPKKEALDLVNYYDRAGVAARKLAEDQIKLNKALQDSLITAEQHKAAMIGLNNQKAPASNKSGDIQALIDQYDRAGALARKLRADQHALNQAHAAGLVPAAQYKTAMAEINRQLTEAPKLVNKYREALIMQSVAVNTIQSLVAGQSVFSTLFVQSSQLLGALDKIPIAALAAGAGIALIAAVAAKASIAIAQAGDAWQYTEGRIQQFVGSSAAASVAMEQMYDLSFKLGTSVQDSAKAFARYRIVTQDVGMTNQEVSRLIETIQKLTIASGASAQEAHSVAIQLSQGLSSGKFHGDELRSVLENSSLMAKALANHFERNIGELREMGAQGLLTRDEMIPALQAIAKEADRVFDGMPENFERVAGRLQTAWDGLLAALDKRLGLSEFYKSFLNQLALAADAWKKLFSEDSYGAGLSKQLSGIETQLKASNLTLEERARLTEEYNAVLELLAQNEARFAAEERKAQGERKTAAKENVEKLLKEAEGTSKLTKAWEEYEKKVNSIARAQQKAHKAGVEFPEKRALKLMEEAYQEYLETKAELEKAALEKSEREQEKHAQKILKLNKKVIDEEQQRRKDAEAARKRGAALVEERQKDADKLIEKFGDEQNNYEQDIRKANNLIDILTVKLGSAEKAQQLLNRVAAELHPSYKEAKDELARYRKDVEKTSDQIGNNLQETLGTTLFDYFEGRIDSIWELFADAGKRAIAAVVASMAGQAVVMPVVTRMVGAAPGLFGIDGPDLSGMPDGVIKQAAKAAGLDSTGGMVANGFSLSNMLGSESLRGLGYGFAQSGLGQSLGLSGINTTGVGTMGPVVSGSLAPTAFGDAFAGGLAGAPWGIAGSLGAGLLGLGWDSPVANAAAGGIGSLGGGMAGFAVGGPVGAAIGAILGSFGSTALGSLFGNKQYPTSIGAARIGAGGRAENLGSVALDGMKKEDADKLMNSVTNALNAVLGAAGASMDSSLMGSPAVGYSKRKALGKGWFSTLDYHGFTGTTRRENFDTPEEAMVDLMKRVLLEGSTGVSDDVRTAAGSIDTKDPERFAELIGFAKTFDDNIKLLNEGVIDFAEAVQTKAKAEIESFVKQIQQFKDTTAAAGMDTQAAAAATRSFVEMVVGIKDAEPPMSEMAKATAAIKAKFEALGPLLTEVGYTAEEAAIVINDNLVKALKKLKDEADTALDAEWFERAGQGFVNQIRNLGKERDQRLTDGYDEGKVLRNYGAGVSGVLDDLGLDQLLDVVLNNSADKTLLDLVGAEIQRRNVLKEQTEIVEKSTKTMEGWSKVLDSIQDYRKSLTLGNFSPLSPRERSLEARRLYQETLAKAQGIGASGSEQIKAAEQLKDVSQAYLQANEDYWASANPAAFQEVQAGLASVESVAEKQITLAQQQLDSTKTGLVLLEKQNDILGDLLKVTLESLGVPVAGAGGSTGVIGRESVYLSSQKDLLAAWTNPNDPNYAWAHSNATTADGFSQFHWQNYGQFENRGFATGGSFKVMGPPGNDNLMMPGLRLTAGEMVNVTRGDSMSAVVAELRAVKAELSAIKTGISQNTQITAATGIEVKNSVDKGNALSAEAVSAARRKASA